jgi:hypothetical protein
MVRDYCRSLVFMFEFGDNEKSLKNMIKFAHAKII